MPVLELQKFERGCGTRVVGGTYIFCDAQNVYPCPSLPLHLPEKCPVCGDEIERFRGIKVINPQRYFVAGQMKPETEKKCGLGCPACFPRIHGAVMWVGRQFYTAVSFSAEAAFAGVSKRIPAKPKDLIAGEWLYLLHPDAFPPLGEAVRGIPGCFMVARITAFHRIISENQRNDEYLINSLEKQGLTPVIEV